MPASIKPSRTVPVVIILGAGLGTRMRSALPKVAHRLGGVPMLRHVIAAAEALDPARIVVVAGPDMPEIAALSAPHAVAVQTERRGTAHAVSAALPQITDTDGPVIVLYGDTPLIGPATLEAMCDALCMDAETGAVVLGFRPADPSGYGRLVMEGDTLARIVEDRDATDGEKAIGLCNSGVMAFDGAALPGWLSRIGCENAKNEFYLTDAIALARADGRRCAVVEGDPDELVGVNAREDLAVAERILQARLRRAVMAAGVTLVAPETVFLSADTRFGRDVVIAPFVTFGPGVSVADNVEIKSFCHIEDAIIAAGAAIGPYARLRPGAKVGPDAHVGNFVEIKKAEIGTGAKVNHLSYVGDAVIGPHANIGAGTITCNYDGYAKSLTEIGAGAFIGSNTALVAPVRVGSGAITGAGSTITRSVPDDALAVGRGRQTVIEGWAARFRRKKSADKKGD